MRMIWDSDLPRAEKFVLLAYLKYSDDVGCISSVAREYVARKTGYTYRQTIRITNSLKARKILVEQSDSSWHIDAGKLPARQTSKNDLRRSFDYRRLFMLIGRRDGFCCHQCDDHGPSLQIDHIHPVSRGGTNAPENLQLLCARCNQAKSNHWDAQ